jgi:hypothetical protein
MDKQLAFSLRKSQLTNANQRKHKKNKTKQNKTKQNKKQTKTKKAIK